MYCPFAGKNSISFFETAKKQTPAADQALFEAPAVMDILLESREEAAAQAVEAASKSLRDLRIAEVLELDMVLDDGKVTSCRAKVKVSFKYEG